MSHMFCRAISFNQYIGNWDVSRVEKMPMMFYEATSFNRNIRNWNILNVKTIFDMFGEDISFSKYHECIINKNLNYI